MMDLADDVETQTVQQGVAAYKVSDGEVFVFTLATLERLFAAARETGKAIVFVKTRPDA